MRIGIFGSASDAQCKAVRHELERRDAEVVVVESQGLNEGVGHAFDGERFFVGGEDVSDVGAWWVRHVMAPLPPTFYTKDLHLFGDWFVEYMHMRERLGFQLSLLVTLARRGVPIVNPPRRGSIGQLKPFQLAAARDVGLEIPRTLVTNDPARVRAFRAEIGDVVYKPSMGGALCRALDDEAVRRLDLITRAPVTFQERVEGASIRATFVDEDLVSCVAISSPELDFRADAAYQAGDQRYEPFELSGEVVERTRRLLRRTGLVFSGVDFIRRSDGTPVFLEANSSPVFLDVERKTGAPISQRLAEHLLHLASCGDPGCFDEEPAERETFVDYAIPGAPHRTVRTSRGGDAT